MGRFLRGSDGRPRTRKNIVDETQDLTADITALKAGQSFTFPGPYSNDAAAAGGVDVGDAYFGPGGGVVIRQT